MNPQPPAAGDGLQAWLDYQLAAHPTEIELGLSRVAAVADRLALRQYPARTLLIGGTNGKGSCVALAGGLIGSRARVGAYTSPHLWRYNERIVIDGVPVADADLVRAFEAIAAVQGTTPLTFFEWGTLAALWLFREAAVDVMLLEVGLGGRLDAVNIRDADVALVTSIGLDHTAWLGDTREAIGAEKAGIFRADRHALCADRDVPASLSGHAAAIGARYAVIGRDFDIATGDDGSWQLIDGDWRIGITPLADVLPDNLIAAVAATRRLGFAVDAADIERAGHAQRRLPGRRETIDGPVPILYDVAHNTAAVARLIDHLRQRPVAGATHIVIGMLADKPVEEIAKALTPAADAWYAVGLAQVTPRGLTCEALAGRLGVAAGQYADPLAGLAAARAAAAPGDRIVVCGSFYTVAQARSPE